MCLSNYCISMLMYIHIVVENLSPPLSILGFFLDQGIRKTDLVSGSEVLLQMLKTKNIFHHVLHRLRLKSETYSFRC